MAVFTWTTMRRLQYFQRCDKGRPDTAHSAKISGFCLISWAEVQVSQAMEPFLKLHFGYDSPRFYACIVHMAALTLSSCFQEPIQQSPVWKKSRLAVSAVQSFAAINLPLFNEKVPTILPAVQSCCTDSQESGSRHDRCSARRDILHLKRD